MTAPKEICPLDPGKTDKQFSIGRPSKKKDCYEQGSNPRTQYSVVGKFWGYIRTIGGRELEIFRQQFPACSHVIMANWDEIFENVTPRDILLWKDKSKTFEIMHIDNVDFQNVLVRIPVVDLRAGVRVA